jgi:UDP-N-acetylglucosamine acyltransferase
MIDPAAYVHPSVKIGLGTRIGRGAYVGEGVEIGADCEIRPNATLLGPLMLGDRNRVFQYATLGDEPQDVHYRGELTQLVIGSDNIFRENVTIHRGTPKGGGVTRIGDHNFFMVGSHLAHDCVVGDHNIFTNYACFAGHIEIEHHVIVSAYCAAHQFTRIGAYSFLSHASLTPLDVPPFMMIAGGDDPYVCGVNTRGLQRNGFSVDEIAAIKRLYKIYYRSGLLQVDALAKISTEIVPLCAKAQHFIDFVKTSRRGVMR